MTEWGLTKVNLETWGPVGRGWSNERTYVAMVKPYSFPLIAYSRAWTPGTNGTVKGDVVLAVINTPEDAEDCRGKLRGKFVMAPRLEPSGTVSCSRNPEDGRTTSGDGKSAPTAVVARARWAGGRGAAANAPVPARLPGQLCGGMLPAPQPAPGQQIRLSRTFRPSETSFTSMKVSWRWWSGPGRKWRRGRNRVRSERREQRRQRSSGTGSGRARSRALRHPDAQCREGLPVSLEMNIENKFYDDDLNSFNVIGEIAGTDKAGEVVMLGAHFDSWHTGTGATDNAAGSAVMLEAMRILKATGLPLRRTVRIALWTGEEQGLFGSQAYVRDHFAVRQSMELKPDHAKLSAYFNVDNGTGQIRGVYMEGNEGARPVFDAWMQPFKDFGMTTLYARGTGGTDHTNSTMSDFRVFSSSRTTSNTTRARITPTWMFTSGFKRKT